MKNLIFGVGRNDAPYPVSRYVGGKRVKCHYYQVWYDLLRRCYVLPSGCKVNSEWHSFMKFKSWMARQPWQGNVLVLINDGKVFSPSSCRFVPRWVSMLFADRGEFQGIRKKGSGYQMNLYAGGIRINKTYPTLTEAAEAYVRAKSAYVRSRYHLLGDAEVVSACERKLAGMHSVRV